MNDVIWKDVPGYEGLYQVSNQGEVKSFAKEHFGLLRKPWIRSDGYLQIQLKVNQKIKNCLVHKLVDEAFNGPVQPGLEVNHIDGIKANCRLANLERVTRQQNVVHAVATGLRVAAKGSSHGRAVLTEEQVAEIRKEVGPLQAGKRLPYGLSGGLAKRYGISRSAMSSILKGGHWSHVE